MTTHDVIIAGLGAMGSAAAWRLTQRGVRVLGFDRFRPPHAMGSSAGRSRIIREAYWENPFYVPLVQRAYLLWEELERRRDCDLLRRTGGIVLGPEEGDLVAGAIRSAEAHGVSYDVMTAAEVCDRYPFRPDAGLVGVLEPRAGILGPEDCISGMLAEAKENGAEFRFEEPVLEWERTEGGEGIAVHTSSGHYEARQLILSAGPWMSGPLPGLNRPCALPLNVARQVMFWIDPLPGVMWGADTCPVWLWETAEGPVYYGFPDVGDGPKVARHHGGDLVDPDSVVREVSEEESVELREFLSGAIPSLAGPVLDAQVCLYTNSPDEHFILDRHPEYPNVLLVSPCSGHGFKFAPTIGEILTDLCLGETPPFDLLPFRLERFSSGDAP